MVLKAVRISASCCSLATDRNRFQMTSKVTASIALVSIDKLHHYIEPFIDAGASPGTDNQRRFAFFDNRRSGELLARLQSGAIIHGSIYIAAVLGKVRAPGPLARARLERFFARKFQIHSWSRTARHYAPVNNLQRHVRPFSSVKTLISFFKG